MFSRSLACALAPVLIAAGIVLSTARWYLEPGRRTSAVFVLLVLVLMTAAFAFATRRARRNQSKRAELRKAGRARGCHRLSGRVLPHLSRYVVTAA